MLGSIVTEVMALFNAVDALEARLGGLTFVKCTQAQYDAMSSHAASTIYFIVED